MSAEVTIVSGLPRSGTSLMMQMLHAGGLPVLTDATRAADEDNPRGYFELEAVKRTRTDASWLDDAPGHAVKMVHLLLYELPADRSYRVVFMKRDLDEVVRSQRVMLDRAGAKGARLPEAQLKAVYESQYRKIEDWMRDASHIEPLAVRYNDLISDPEPVIAAVDAFLGGGLDRDAMRGAVDPALYRQRGSGPPPSEGGVGGG